MERQYLLEKSKRQAYGDTMFKQETEKTMTLRNVFDEEIWKFHLKMKENKKLMDPRRKQEVLMHDLDRLQKINKELVAKLEEVEIDKKIMVENRIELMKILDEETKKVSCLEKKILEDEEKLEAEREKNRVLEEEVDKYKRFIEENDLIERWQKLEMMERVASVEERLEKAGGTEADDLESQKLVDGNTDEYEDTMFGNEDDTVYVDFDGFHVVGNF
ncbi:uncharacterized protein LOC141646401 [Silene latifolia]|uniref:uncharacterized protein LOC141646401 n=1 Tax=Silene latifolia TaxID=37657 RepID=UPI003D76BC7F